MMEGINENGQRLWVVSQLSEAALPDQFADPWAASPCKQNIYLIVFLACGTVPTQVKCCTWIYFTLSLLAELGFRSRVKFSLPIDSLVY